MATWTFDAIGTRWQIETDEELTSDARAAVRTTIDGFDREWSRFRPDSLVSRLGAEGGIAVAPQDTVAMLDTYAELSAATHGAINPLVGDSLSALGYDASYRLTPETPVPAGDWTILLDWSESELVLSGPATLDVGALGKGRLVDRVLAVLDAVPGRVLVDAGGDLRVRGGTARIGLEHPYDATKAIGLIEIADSAIAGSAINRRAWGDGLHHVLDARTGLPVRTWAATWAFAEDTMTADAIATALFFDEGPELAARRNTTWVRMSTDGRVEYSPHCPAQLFTRR